MSKKKTKAKQTIWALLFIAPFFVLFTVFTIYPIAQGVFVSLNRWTLMGRMKFVGLQNYQRLFRDHFFVDALWHTSFFVLLVVPLVVLLSLICALFANRPTCVKKFLRVAYYLPGILSVSVASFIAKYSFAPYRGLVNGVLKSFGLISTKTEPLWLQDPRLVWWMIVLMTTWWTLGFPMLLFLSALQDLSPEMMEAAQVDGAADWQILFLIQLPLIKNTIFLVVMLQIIASFKVFGQIYMMTGGGPSNQTRPLIQYIYQQAFNKNDLGYASAMSYVLFAILVVCTLIQLQIQRKGGEE